MRFGWKKRETIQEVEEDKATNRRGGKHRRSLLYLKTVHTQVFSEMMFRGFDVIDLHRSRTNTWSQSTISSSSSVLGAVTKSSPRPRPVFSSNPPTPPPSKTDHLLHQSVRRCTNTTEFNLSGNESLKIDAKVQTDQSYRTRRARYRDRLS